MNHDEWSDPHFDPMDDFDPASDDEAPELDRVEVLLRALYSVLFALVISLMNSLLFVLVAFQLVYSLIAQRLPGEPSERLDPYFRFLRFMRYLFT